MSDVRTGVPTFRLGDSGDAVVEIRSRLTGLGLLGPGDATYRSQGAHARTGADAFDEYVDQAVRAFQQRRGLTADGVVGPATYRVLDEARWGLGDRLLTHVPGSVISGDDVVTLQQRLLDLGFKVGRVDGMFGHRTEQAVRDFQRNIGIPPDGTCGPATLKALHRLAPRVKGGRPNAMRAEERIRRAGPQLTGKIVVIDPAATRAEDPALNQRAAAVTHDLARRVEGRLMATGVQAFLTQQHADDARTETERAEFANRTDAHLSVSLHVDASDNPGACGVSTYFYGSDAHDVRSSVGERFASLVQREIVARTDLADLRIHTKTWDFLRRTRMPAVRIDVGYITNPGDASRLEDPGFRDVVAEAVVVAVQRVYLSPETDPKTGVLRLGELREALRREERRRDS
ncbi:MAG TPA: peptidoglycan-binding protein [Nocardioidaceae bacterium]|nr:peptidoglycan-binding protein [Nocardioidaceae bacterium]